MFLFSGYGVFYSFCFLLFGIVGCVYFVVFVRWVVGFVGVMRMICERWFLREMGEVEGGL